MTKTDLQRAKIGPFARWLLYILGGVLIILIIIQLFLSFWVDDYAADYLKKQVNKTQGAYSIDFDDLSLNVFDGSVNIDNLRIRADTAAFSDTLAGKSPPPKMLFRGKMGEVDLSGINVFSAIRGDELHIGSITISEPDIAALKNPNPSPKDSSSQFSTLDSTIYAAISNRYSAIEIGGFTIRNGHGTIIQSGDTLSSLGQLNFRLQNIRVDSASAQSGRRFITDNFSLKAKNFRYQLSDSVNTIAFDKLGISSEDQRITFDSLALIPRYPRFKYSRVYGGKLDRIELTIPELRIRQIDFSRYIDSGRFYASHIVINGARLEDFLNRSIQGGPPKPRPLPFIAFRNLKQPVKIDSLHINDTFVSYTEYVGNTPQAGTVTFENLEAEFQNISNYREDIKDGITTTLNTRSRVMGDGLLEVNFEFPMDTKNGFHTINGNLNRMPITAFNRMTKHVAFVKIDRGILNSLKFEMVLNKERSSGTVIMNYKNLKVSVLDKQSLEQRGLLENVKTFVANKLVVKQSNTPRAGRIDFERVESKSIFNFWWKSLLSGIKNAVK